MVRITFAGYFGAHKGIDVLIRAVAKTGRNDIQINLIGSGAEEENYKTLATSLGIARQLHFWGRLSNDEIIRAYRETDIYCLPSVWPENQPVSITEAMACGIPVIASDLGGNRELVQDRVTGYLFPAGNADVLAEKLTTLCDDTNLQRRMGEAGRARMADADLHQQAARLAELYDSLPSSPVVRSKPLILLKGTVLPPLIHRFTRHDVVLWDWVLDDWDLDQARALVILPGEKMSVADLKRAKAFHIPLLVPSQDAVVYQGESEMVMAYADETEMLRMIARL